MKKYMVTDRLTEEVVGLFDTIEEATLAAEAHGDTAAITKVTDDPEIERAWDLHREAEEKASQAAEEAARKVVQDLPKDWRILIDGLSVTVQNYRTVANRPEEFTWAHGEDFEPAVVKEWITVHDRDQMPPRMWEVYDAARKAARNAYRSVVRREAV